MNCQVIDTYTDKVVFEGDADACRKYICDRANYHRADGSAFVRNWIDNGNLYWDVGNVYIFNDPAQADWIAKLSAK